MNLLRALIPCALHRGCWPDDDRMTVSEERISAMGASPSNLTSAGGITPPIQAYAPAAPAPVATEPLAGVRERKKRVSGFATLRRRLLLRRRRTSKSCDHGRALRDLLSTWTPQEAQALLDEYEALAALKDLAVQAELARRPAATVRQDLARLLEAGHCADVELVLRGACFPVHRALLSARCPRLREVLSVTPPPAAPGRRPRIELRLQTLPVDVATLAALLRAVYGGEAPPTWAGDDPPIPHSLEHDLRYLLESGDLADAALVFTADGENPDEPTTTRDSGCSEYGFRPRLELPCHKAVLAARSPFFRSVLERRTRSCVEPPHLPTRILLDECVIPKRYARVLLHALYLDAVDLSLISRNGPLLGPGGADASSAAIAAHHLDEAMELYQIGRFLELDILAQGCEDLIAERLSPEALPAVLRWGAEPHGSAWTRRQAMHYLREEFDTIARSPVLLQLTESQLAEVLSSHFVQASELTLLQATLRWAEARLARRVEDREPNLLSHTAHSVARKGVRRRDLSDAELREVLRPLAPLLRLEHVLPARAETLQSALRRGLLSTPPSRMLGGEHHTDADAWLRGSPIWVRPRLFSPYHDELKVYLRSLGADLGPMGPPLGSIPDALYMVEERPRGLDVVTAAAASLPGPDASTMSAMARREAKLRQAAATQRALALPLSCRREVARQLRLRVVREFALPDHVADLLERACYCPQPQPRDPLCHYGRHLTFPARARPPSDESGHLSDTMPDVAMGSASLSQLHLSPPPPPMPPPTPPDLGGPLPRLRYPHMPPAYLHRPPHRFI